MGYAAMMQWRTEESLAAFRKVVSLTPSSAAAHGHLSHGLAFAHRDVTYIWSSHCRDQRGICRRIPREIQMAYGAAIHPVASVEPFQALL